MKRRDARLLLRTIGPIVAALGAFALLHHDVAALETRADAGALRLVGVDSVHQIGVTTIRIDSPRGAWVSVLRPSCSSLGVMLALTVLASVLPSPSRWWRVRAAVLASGTVFVANLVRICGSLALGVPLGRRDAVLFHDWVGSTFGFAYTLGGLVLMTACLLKGRTRARVPRLTSSAVSRPVRSVQHAG
jgi:exosortase/archaeosortase family protein